MSEQQITRWRPIETAPKDGTTVDLWCRPSGWLGGSPMRMTDYWWVEGIGWRTNQRERDLAKTKWNDPTHWMPPPEPPHA